MPKDHTAQFTARATMDRETLRDYEKVIDPRVIVKDHRTSTSLPAVFGETTGRRGENIRDAVPYSRPWGLSWGRKEGPLKDDDAPKAG